jgi:hypothetical protein
VNGLFTNSKTIFNASKGRYEVQNTREIFIPFDPTIGEWYHLAFTQEKVKDSLGNVVETAVDVSSKNHSAIFPIELPSLQLLRHSNFSDWK